MAQQIIRSIGSDGLDVLSNILDKNTGEYITYKEVNAFIDGTPMEDAKVDGVIYIKKDNKYLKRSFYGGADVKWFGAKGDGVTDDTASIQKAFDSWNNIIITKGVYIINPISTTSDPYDGGVKPNSNSNITFENGSAFKINGQSSTGYCILGVTNKENITINNATIIGDVTTHIGSSGEWGHGIMVRSSDNINLNNCKVSECWGDGIVYTTMAGITKPCNGGIVKDCITDSNRRQGFSIISWVKGTVNGGVYKNTGRILTTNPSFGIDIEPNPAGYDMVDVVLNNVTTENNIRGGIQFTPGYMSSANYNGKKRFYNVIINNFQSYDDGQYGMRFNDPIGSESGYNPNVKIDGQIYINGVKIERSEYSAIRFDKYQYNSPKAIINNIHIINANNSKSIPTIGNISQEGIASAISIATWVGQESFADLSLNNINIEEVDRAEPYHYHPIYFVPQEGLSASHFKVTNLITTPFRSTIPSKVRSTKFGPNSYIRYNNDNIIIKPTSFSINQNSYNGETISSDSTILVNLPSITPYGEQRFTFVGSDGNVIEVKPNINDTIRVKGSTQGASIKLYSKEDKITIVSNMDTNTWDVLAIKGRVASSNMIPSNIENSYISNSIEPIEIASSGDYYYNSSTKIWYRSNGLEWIPLNNKAPSLTVSAPPIPGDVYDKDTVKAIRDRLESLVTSLRTANMLNV